MGSERTGARMWGSSSESINVNPFGSIIQEKLIRMNTALASNESFLE